MVLAELRRKTRYPSDYRPLPTRYDAFRGFTDVFAENFTKEAQVLLELFNKTVNYRSYHGGVGSSELKRIEESPEFELFLSSIAQYPDLAHLVDCVLPFDNAVFSSFHEVLIDAMALQDWQAKQMRNPAINLELKLKKLVEYQPRLPVWLSSPSND